MHEEQSGRFLRRPQQDYPAATVADFCTAVLRLLDTIPDNLLFDEAPVAETVWESSRLFVSHHVPLADRRKVHAKLVSDLGSAARQVGAKTCLTLLNANWPLWAGRVGVAMTAMGPVMTIDGVRNQVVAMDFSSNLH